MKCYFTLLLALASTFLIGCGRQSKTVVGPDGSKATITEKGDGSEVTITGPKGETVRVAGGEGGVALPEGFPKDVPIYPGAKVTTSATTQEMMTAVLTTSDAAKKVTDFYSENLKANQWTVLGTVNMAEGGMSNATKGKMTCSIHIARGDDQTTVTLGVGPQNQ